MNRLYSFVSSFLSLFLVVVFSGCKDQNAQEQVNILPQITVVDIIVKDVPIYQEFVGEVKGLYDIPIRARVDGYLEEVNFQEGGPVKKGQLLYVIDSHPFEAELASKKSDLAEAETQLVRAEADLKRIRPLAEKKAVSQSDLDAAIAEEGAARASVEAAHANLEMANINLSYTRIMSPIRGVIGHTQAKKGEYVGKVPNPVILNTVSRLDTILVQFFITESDYLALAREFNLNIDSLRHAVPSGRPERKANVELILSDGSSHDYFGSVDFIDREVDPTTGSMLVQASFRNPKGIIRPGQFARAKIETRIIKDAKLIPVKSFIDVQGKLNIYVLKDDNTVEMREIKTLGQYGDLALVMNGIENGDQIVLDGIQKIRSGMTVSAEKVEFKSKSDNPF